MVMYSFATKVKIKQNKGGQKTKQEIALKAYHGWLKKSDRRSFSALRLGSPATNLRSLL